MGTSKKARLNKALQKRVRSSAIYILVLILLFSAVMIAYRGGMQLARLDPEQMTIQDLPWAILLSFFRMSISLFLSLIFALVLGLLAALTRTGERIILPVLDIFQSIPVVGFFPVAITFFISISNGHRIGIEFAAIFLIFTSQAWNMAFAVYEAVKAIPSEKLAAVESFGVHGSQKFWKLYFPAATPRLVNNAILSWSNGWFFLVACEIIAVGPIQYQLAGIGSFLANSAQQNEIHLVFWGLGALTVFILAIDILVWSPLTDWAERFKIQETPSAPHPTFALSALFWEKFQFIENYLKTVLKALIYPFFWLGREIIVPLFWSLPVALIDPHLKLISEILVLLRWPLLISTIGGAIYGGFELGVWFLQPWPSAALANVKWIPLAVLNSTLRLIFSMTVCLALILPLIFFIWDKPKLRRVLMSLSQVGASIPAVALFPLIVLVAVRKFGGGMELASIVLLLTGMVWYLLFNCLGGIATIPIDLIQATKTLGLTRFVLWKRLVFPAMRPALVTGAITAWGGGWNALVVSEYVLFKSEVLEVFGIGAMLNHSVYQSGDGRIISLCLIAMIFWIILINTLFWRPLYERTLEKYRLEG
jgi:NitT/TauT family transport system permease protein